MGAVGIAFLATVLAEHYAGELVAIITFVLLFGAFLLVYIPFVQVEYRARRRQMLHSSQNVTTRETVEDLNEHCQNDTGNY